MRKRWYIILLLMIGLSILSLPFIIKTETAQSYIRIKLHEMFHQQLHVQLDFQSIDISWLPLGIQLKRVQAIENEGGFSVIAEELSVAPNWFLILAGQLSIGDIRISQPQVLVDLPKLVAAESKTDVTTSSSTTSTGQVNLDRLDMSNAHIDVKLSAEHTLTLKHFNLLWLEDLPNNYIARFSIEQVLTNFENRHNQFHNLDMVVELSGPLLNPDTIVIHNLKLVDHINNLHLLSKGTVNLMDHAIQNANLDGSIKASIQSFSAIFPSSVPKLAGLIDYTWNFSMDKAWPTISGYMKLIDFQLAQRSFGNAYGNVSIDPNMMTIKNLQISSLISEGVLNGEIQFDKRFTTKAWVSLSSFSLGSLIETIDTIEVPITMDIDGKIALSGQLAPFYLAGSVNLGTRFFSIFNNDFRDPKAKEVFRAHPLQLNGNIKLNRSGIEFLPVAIRNNAHGQLRVNGNINWLSGYYDMRINGQQLDLDTILDIPTLPMHGIGNLDAIMEGSLGSPEVSATVDMKKVGILGYKTDQAKLTVFFKDLALSIPSMKARIGGGTVHGSLNLDVKPTPIPLTIRSKFSNVPIKKFVTIITSANQLPLVKQDLQGLLSGDLTITGTLDEPEGLFYGNLKNPAIGSFQLDKARLKLELTPVQTTSEAWLYSKNNTLYLAGQYHLQTQAIHLEGNGEQVDLTFINELTDNQWISGQASFATSITYADNKWNGHTTINTQHLEMYSFFFDKMEIPLSINDNKITAIANNTEKSLLIDAAVDTQKETWHLNAHLNDFNIASFIQHGFYNSTCSGEVSIASTFQTPLAINGIADIDTATLSMYDLAMHNKQPWKIEMQKGVLHLHQLSLHSSNANIAIDGTLDLNGPLALGLSLKADGSVLPLLIQPIQYAEGHFLASAQISGTLSDPFLIGSGTYKKGVVRIEGIPQPLLKMSGQVTLGSAGFFVDRLKAKWGDGNVFASGDYTFKEGELNQNVEVQFNHVSLSPYPGIQGSFSGQTRITGPLDQTTIAGALTFHDIFYTESISMEGLLPSFDRRPLEIADIEKESEWLLYNIRLDAPKNVIVNNNFIEGEFALDLRLTGSIVRPGLLGQIIPLESKIKYRNNVFDVTSASIDFLEEFRIYPRLELKASSQACGDYVDIEIRWQPDQEAVIMTSGKTTDGQEVPSEEVLRCLQFGFKAEDMEEYASGSGTGAYLPGSLELLTAMTGLDEKAKKLIPLPIDSFRITSGYSRRTKTYTPWLTLGFQFSTALELKLSSSLVETNSQEVNLEYRLSDVTSLNWSWQSDSDINIGDLGMYLQFHWEF